MTINLQDDTEFQKRRDIAIKQFNSFTYSIIGEVSSILKQAKLQPMPQLQCHNPSFSKVVEELKIFFELSRHSAGLLKLDCDSELNHIKKCIDLVDDLAKAIEKGDSDALCEATCALDDEPYV